MKDFALLIWFAVLFVGPLFVGYWLNAPSVTP